MQLNETEKDIIQILLKNDQLLGVVRKVFEQTIETNRPQIMPTDNNELLGERYRAYDLARNIVEVGFKTLTSYKKSEKVEKTINRAR